MTPLTSAVNSSRVQIVIEKIFMLSVVIEASKKSVTFLFTPFANRCLVYSDWALYRVYITLHSSSARLDGIHPVQIHLITAVYVIKRLSLYVNVFTLCGRDLVSVVRIRESPYYRVCFSRKISENFVGALEAVRNRENCPYRGVRLYFKGVAWALAQFLGKKV